MRTVALRGLLARKLRLVLTALAVALGVDADRRHLRLHGHDQPVVRPDLHQSATRAPTSSITPRTTIDTVQRRRRPSRRSSPLGRSRRSAAARRRRAPPARSSTPAPCSTRTASASARAARRASSLVGRSRRASTPSRSPRAARRRRPTRWRSTQSHRRQRSDFKLGDKIAVVGDGAAQATYTIVGHRRDRRRRLASAARRSRSCTLPEAQRMLGKHGLSTRSRSPAKPGVTPEQLRDQLRPTLPRRRSTVRTGQRGRPASSRATSRTTSSFLTHAAAGRSPASRCSSARSSSSTPSRSRSPSGCASSRCCATLGATRRQVLRSVARRGPDDRPARLGRRPPARRRLVAGGLRALFQAVRRRPAVERHRSSRRARSSSRWSSARSSRSLVDARAGAARDARAARSRRCARARCRRAAGRSRTVTIAGDPARSLGVGLMAVGLFGIALGERGAELRGRRRAR